MKVVEFDHRFDRSTEKFELMRTHFLPNFLPHILTFVRRQRTKMGSSILSQVSEKKFCSVKNLTFMMTKFYVKNENN